MQTIQQALDWCQQQFLSHDLYYGHGTENALDESYFLVFTICGIDFDSDQSVLSQSLNSRQVTNIQFIAQQRIVTRKPLAYLLQTAWFCGYPFYINEQVLVPRSPIAELIDAQYQSWLQPEKISTVLEIGTGSGCIAIATALKMPWVTVDAGDICQQALAVAGKNIEKYDLQRRVHLRQTDVFEGLSDQKYDLIVSNPPYVDAQDIAEMPAEYHAEPILGLAAGQDGLDIVRRIIAGAAQYLTDQGILIVEVGNSAPALEAAFPDLPFLWLAFENGGQGVFLLQRSDLVSIATSL